MDESTAHDDLELDIRIALGTARMALFGWPHSSVSGAFERAFELAESSGRQQAFGPILRGLCIHYWTRSEFRPTLHWLGKLESIADDIDDAELSAVRDMSAGCQYFWQAAYHRARRYTTHIRDTYDEPRHAHIVSYANHDPLVFSLHWAGGLLEWITGYPDRGLEMVDEAVTLARRIGHPFNCTFALTAGSECLALRGETKRLLDQCDEADVIIEEEGLGDFARNMMSNNWRRSSARGHVLRTFRFQRMLFVTIREERLSSITRLGPGCDGLVLSPRSSPAWSQCLRSSRLSMRRSTTCAAIRPWSLLSAFHGVAPQPKSRRAVFSRPGTVWLTPPREQSIGRSRPAARFR
jgi:hypothetical protein